MSRTRSVLTGLIVAIPVAVTLWLAILTLVAVWVGAR